MIRRSLPVLILAMAWPMILHAQGAALALPGDDDLKLVAVRGHQIPTYLVVENFFHLLTESDSFAAMSDDLGIESDSAAADALMAFILPARALLKPEESAALGKKPLSRAATLRRLPQLFEDLQAALEAVGFPTETLIDYLDGDLRSRITLFTSDPTAVYAWFDRADLTHGDLGLHAVGTKSGSVSITLTARAYSLYWATNMIKVVGSHTAVVNNNGGYGASTWNITGKVRGIGQPTIQVSSCSKTGIPLHNGRADSCTSIFQTLCTLFPLYQAETIVTVSQPSQTLSLLSDTHNPDCSVANPLPPF